MRTYVVRSYGRIVGVIEAPSDSEARALAANMWDGTSVARTSDVEPAVAYHAFAVDLAANNAAHFAESR